MLIAWIYNSIDDLMHGLHDAAKRLVWQFTAAKSRNWAVEFPATVMECTLAGEQQRSGFSMQTLNIRVDGDDIRPATS
jgi:hypothetical protein